MSMTGRYLQLPGPVLARAIASPSIAEELMFSAEPSSDYLDIDKTWHIIQFLLTVEAWGGEGYAAVPILGGTELPATDAGYGPIRYLHAAEVEATAKYLENIPFEHLWAGFVPEQAARSEINPGEWAKGEAEHTYVERHYKALQQFFSSASRDRRGMLMGLS